MKNLLNETKKAINGRSIKWAKLVIDGFALTNDFDAEGETIVLKSGYGVADIAEFYDELDFDYDNGFGTQVVDGTIVFTDGTWLTRGEYDGSEWWENHVCPQEP